MGVSAQGFLNGLSNHLTSAVGGEARGEVDGYENAPYQVVNSYDGYEERYYPSNMWVCTRSGGFMNLFRYISGDNSRDQKIDMTVPVMMTHDENSILLQETQSCSGERQGQSGGLLVLHCHELRQPLEDNEQKERCDVQENLVVICTSI